MTLKMIGIEKETKSKLDKLKLYSRETYDDVIVRLIEDKDVSGKNAKG